MWSLAGQRYLSASRELWLTAEDHRPVHKLITDTQKQRALQSHVIKPNTRGCRMHLNESSFGVKRQTRR